MSWSHYTYNIFAVGDIISSVLCSSHHKTHTQKEGLFIQIYVNKRKKKQAMVSASFTFSKSQEGQKQRGGCWSPPSRAGEAVPDRKQREGESLEKQWLSGRAGVSGGPPDLERDKVWEVQWVVGKEPCFMQASPWSGRTSAHHLRPSGPGPDTGVDK